MPASRRFSLRAEGFSLVEYRDRMRETVEPCGEVFHVPASHAVSQECEERERVTEFPPTEEEKTQIGLRLQALELEHQDLDDVILRLSHDPAQDQLQLRRLKKRKLVLKDQIQKLRARLIPDIIA